MRLAPSKLEDLTIISDNSSLIHRYQDELDNGVQNNFKAFKKAKVAVGVESEDGSGSGTFTVDHPDPEEESGDEDELADVEELLGWSSEDDM